METLQTEHGVFTNNEATSQSAQQVYDEWLINKNNPPVPPPSDKNRIAELEQVINMILTGEI